MNPAIVVTGAASGIGREIARIAAREGCAMVIIDRDGPALDDLAAEFGRLNVRAEALVLDLTRHDSGRRVEEALAELGLYCDVLVNSAGFGLFGPAADIDRDEQLSLIDLNARALTALTLHFVPGMLARRRGGILNVGSITGYAPGPNMAVYHASKAYVRSFTMALARELVGTGVTATCLCPGIVITPFFQRASALVKTRLVKLLPRSTARRTAEVGWHALRAGKRLAIPHLADRLVVLICSVLPDAVLLRLIAALQQGR